jgi:hypothetical protein
MPAAETGGHEAKGVKVVRIACQDSGVALLDMDVSRIEW